jgi:catechol 2,3-dioxygenase-like lactoylglutathione lyase family enzyme
MKFQLHRVIYFCADMEKMTRFYSEVMGLRAVERPLTKPEDWMQLEGGTFTLCLHRSGKPGSASGNKNKLVFYVDDVVAARDYLKTHKVKMGVIHQYGESAFSDGHDPEGNKFQIAGPVGK